MKSLILLALSLCLFLNNYAQGIRHHCRRTLNPQESYYSNPIFETPLESTPELEILQQKIALIQKLSGHHALDIQLEAGIVPYIHSAVEWKKNTAHPPTKRLIRYSSEYIHEFVSRQKGHKNWLIVGQLAHGIAHHVHNHLLSETGASSKEELEADEYAGYIIGLMGGDLQDAMAFLTPNPLKYYGTDPLLYRREAAIAMGWERGCTSKQASLPTHPNMIWIEGGSFKMGCTSEQRDCHVKESPTHRVTLSDYYMSPYELTIREYDAYLNAIGKPKSRYSTSEYGDLPMIMLTWYDAIEYCNWRSKQEGLTPCYTIEKHYTRDTKYPIPDWDIACDFQANGYRLPTEAEWEYAARERGKAVLFGNGTNIADFAEINFNSISIKEYDYALRGIQRNRTVSVTSFSPNSLGLYNMSGNVSEWCWDWDSSYTKSAKTNPHGPNEGENRIVRGGYLLGPAECIRVAARGKDVPYNSSTERGFRLARTAP